MSTSTIKSSAADPSNLDSIVVCRLIGHVGSEGRSVETVRERAIIALRECKETGVKVGYADVESVVRGSVLGLHTVPGNSLSVEELAAEAGAAVAVAAAALGVRSNRG